MPLNFIAWIMEDINTVTAEVGTPRDVQLKEFERQGFLKFGFETHNTNTYSITSKWMQGCE